jgi:hypothetical protein
MTNDPRKADAKHVFGNTHNRGVLGSKCACVLERESLPLHLSHFHCSFTCAVMTREVMKSEDLVGTSAHAPGELNEEW